MRGQLSRSNIRGCGPDVGTLARPYKSLCLLCVIVMAKEWARIYTSELCALNNGDKCPRTRK